MFFRDSNVSISRFEEYTDSQYFFARLEWHGDHPWETTYAFDDAFKSVANTFENANYRAHFFEKPQKLGLFSSKEPHALICLLYTSPSPRDQRGSRMPSSA